MQRYIIMELVTGLIAAVVTLIGNNFIQKYLHLWKEKNDQKKISYIYIVKLSFFVALSRLIKLYISTMLDGKSIVEVNDYFEKEVDKIQGLIIIISKNFKNKLFEDINLLKEIREIQKNQQNLTDLLEFQINIETLMKLPRNSIFEYQILNNSLNSFKFMISYWLRVITDREEEVDPFKIYQTWKIVEKIDKYADSLMKLFISEADVKNNDAAILLSKQISDLQESFAQGTVRNEILETLKSYNPKN